MSSKELETARSGSREEYPYGNKFISVKSESQKPKT